MRVLMPVPPATTYNATIHWMALCRGLRAAGATVIPYGGSADHYGGEVVPFDAARRMDAVIREAAADVYLTCSVDPEYAGWADAVRSGVPCVAGGWDFHYRRNLDQFAGAALVYVRAARAEQSALTMRGGKRCGPVRWLPFSVDVSRLAPPTQPRRRSVYFAGARQWWAYPARSDALDALGAAGLLSDEAAVNRYVDHDEYLAALGRHGYGLTCGSIYGLTVAKHVEIAAAGALLLTDGPYGLDRLIPPHLWLRYDPATVVEQVRRIEADPALAEALADVAAQAQAHVLAHHTDEVRGRELMEMILNVL